MKKPKHTSLTLADDAIEENFIRFLADGEELLVTIENKREDGTIAACDIFLDDHHEANLLKFLLAREEERR